MAWEGQAGPRVSKVESQPLPVTQGLVMESACWGHEGRPSLLTLPHSPCSPASTSLSGGCSRSGRS